MPVPAAVLVPVPAPVPVPGVEAELDPAEVPAGGFVPVPVVAVPVGFGAGAPEGAVPVGFAVAVPVPAGVGGCELLPCAHAVAPGARAAAAAIDDVRSRERRRLMRCILQGRRSRGSPRDEQAVYHTSSDPCKGRPGERL